MTVTASPRHEPARAKIAVIGFGEFGTALIRGLADHGQSDVYVFSRARPDSSALADRVGAAGATLCTTLEDAVTKADVIVSAVPATAASEIARRCAQSVRPGALFVDISPQLPEAKEAGAAAIEQAGGTYADVAILGTVATDGFRAPMLVCGSGARVWQSIAAGLGIDVTVIDGPAGSASLVKLLRSVYLKGRDGLIVELLLAARAYGLDETVVRTITGAREQVPFPDLVTRVMCGLAVHAERRADELSKSAVVVEAAGIEPLVTRAGVERLRRLAELELRTRFAGGRPSDLEAVLAAIDKASSGQVS